MILKIKRKGCEMGIAQNEMIELVGVQRKMQSFNLPHEVYCEAIGECGCSTMPVTTSFYSKVDQTFHKKIISQRICKSITVRHGHSITVPRAVLECPEVKAALESKPARLRVNA